MFIHDMINTCLVKYSIDWYDCSQLAITLVEFIFYRKKKKKNPIECYGSVMVLLSALET